MSFTVCTPKMFCEKHRCEMKSKEKDGDVTVDIGFLSNEDWQEVNMDFLGLLRFEEADVIINWFMFKRNGPKYFMRYNYTLK